MPESPTFNVRMITPSQVAESLSIDVDEVITLVMEGRLRGARVGAPPQWRVEETSVVEYLDQQIEEARQMALWNQSNLASFPEVWGAGFTHRAE